MPSTGRVLIVENNASARAYLRTVLRREAFEVEAVGDGEGAVKVLAVREYAVVLLDLYLGVMSGFEVLDFMRANEVSTPVIVISGAEEEALAAARQSPLVKLVMPKPLDTKKLIVALNKLYSR